MCFSVENKIVQADDIWIREYQKEVLERFRHPEALF
jgi:hypothetical protein